MPTNRRRITRKLKVVVTDNVRRYLETGVTNERDIEVYLLSGNTDQLAARWNSQKEVILSEWIENYPGSRPWAWWMFDAQEGRKRTGGKGQAINEKYPAWVEYLDKGIPASWHWIDRTDPPTFESQAAYLDRYGLLKQAEKKKLKVSDYKPVKIEVK